MFKCCLSMHSILQCLFISCTLLVILLLLEDGQECKKLIGDAFLQFVGPSNGCFDTSIQRNAVPFDSSTSFPSFSDLDDTAIFGVRGIRRRDICTDALPGTVSNLCKGKTLCCQ